MFLDSDTKVALLSGSPSEVPQDWFLTNEMKAEARARVNKDAGSRRMLSHAIFTPGYPGWLEQVDHAIRDLKPDSFKGYTIGDTTNKNLSKHPWRMDDDKLVYTARRAGHRPHRRAEGGVRAGGEPAEQPALRLRGGVAGLTGARATRIAGRGGDSVTTRPRARGAGR